MLIERSLRIRIHGLGRGSAGARTVERELASAGGGVRVRVNPATETAYVDYDPRATDTWMLTLVIEQAGYHAGRPAEA